MVTTFRAAWVLPIVSPPIPDGWVAVEDGRILAVGRGDPPPEAGRGIGRGRLGGSMVDLGHAAVLPALVNAHTHLELAWLRGCVPPTRSMPAWVRTLMACRRAGASPPGRVGEPGGGSDPVARAATLAIEEMRAAGTAAAGDIGNTTAAVAPLRGSGRFGARSVCFLELIGFRHVPLDDAGADPPATGGTGATDRSGLAARRKVDRAVGEIGGYDGESHGAAGPARSLAAHAPYSVSPALFKAVAAAARTLSPRWACVHLAESPEERQFLEDGTGPWRALLEDLGAWEPSWSPPACGPVEYLERVGFAHPRMVVVHGTQLTRPEIDRLAEYEATIVVCPRSNAWVGAGAPPVADFFASGINIAVGTDSLASNDDLNVFHELAAMRRLAPAVPGRRLLAAATLGGARALGGEGAFGSIESGKQDALIAVALPGRVADVEDHLLGGIVPSQIQWLESAAPPPRSD